MADRSIREMLAREAVEELNEHYGTLAVEILELECKRFLVNKPRILGRLVPYPEEQEGRN